MPAVLNTWLVVVPVAEVPSPKFHWAEVMLSVEEPALKDALSGAEAMAELNAVQSAGAVGSVTASSSLDE